MTRSWMLMTAEGRHLGTYDGETREEAVRAMYEADPAFETLSFFLQRELERLVELWGGRAVRVGSIPAMAAVTMESETIPPLDPCPATEREVAP